MSQRLTQDFVNRAVCPVDQAEAIWQDAELKQMQFRVRRTGSKSYTIRYRANGHNRRFSLDAGNISLGEARRQMRIKLGAIEAGDDPVGERQAERKRDRARLTPALDRYEQHLASRQVVNRGPLMSLLRRELLVPFGNVELAELTRYNLSERIENIEASGRPGAARELKTRASVFFNWAADVGLVPTNPLAGKRRERRTRAEALAIVGRALTDDELPAFWSATNAGTWPFGSYLKILLLCGQRRTETSIMRWQDLDPHGCTWTIPASISKSGRPNVVPLPPMAMEIIKRTGRTSSPLVFPGHARNGAITGWWARLVPVRQAAGLDHWTLHDLRRTMRTGLGRLGVDRVIAELLLNHAQSDELARIYDRAEYWEQRVDAANRWAQHVAKIVQA